MNGYCCLDHALCDVEICENARAAFAHFLARPEVPRWCGETVGSSGALVFGGPS